MGRYLTSTRADSLKDSEAYPKLEAAMFSEFNRKLSAINYDVMPKISALFLETKDLLDQYLDIKQFQSIAISNYEQMKAKEWYFRAGSDYNYTPGKDATDGDVIKAVESCPNREYTTPASWHEMERVKQCSVLG